MNNKHLNPYSKKTQRQHFETSIAQGVRAGRAMSWQEIQYLASEPYQLKHEVMETYPEKVLVTQDWLALYA